MKFIKLNNGIEIPSAGLGTWLIGNDKVARVVCDAVENEKGVGRWGIKECGVSREEEIIDYTNIKKNFYYPLTI